MTRAELLDDSEDLAQSLVDVLAVIFSRFCAPAPAQPLRLGDQPPADGALDSEALDRWATATNGQPLPEDQKEEITEFLDCDDEGRLTFKGFVEMYHLQTTAEPDETWRDLKAHGFGEDLKPLANGKKDEDTADARKEGEGKKDESKKDESKKEEGNKEKASDEPAMASLSLSSRPTTPADEAGDVSSLIAQLEKFASSDAAASDAGDEPPAEEQREAAQQLADEVAALQSIYGDDSLHLLSFASSAGPSSAASTSAGPWRPGQRLRFAISTTVEPPARAGVEDESIPIRLSATLPAHYPASASPPQLQLLSRYVGDESVDHTLFGQVLKAYLHSSPADGVAFTRGEVALFEGTEWVRERIAAWYAARVAERTANGRASAPAPARQELSQASTSIAQDAQPSQPGTTTFDDDASSRQPLPKIFSAPALTERKSVFVGHAARITSPDEVPRVLASLLADRKVARATHPAIHAWVCRPEGAAALHRDCDDDGESAAGGRLAHLLDVLGVENVLVVVTRWYGGIHLGADRFKLINRAARDALELASVVDGPLNPEHGVAAKGAGKKGARK
ncbi:UPF0029-domain-containing protein [Tilletiopsis washingtonensis]|uniref:UPF0029-domain-containing protein n=1 Tax=Tilletiopsis washingtonensis TaxID=58919 RepID=A0A316ZIY5_9BASI|nr:UPF0029-domain-containing protein [Tilletiopsis washingtonensis]PWO01059.1 UPF0029-domain-containing protein [Tilletiopsis washingtonensis]